jgi:ferredoxin
MKNTIYYFSGTGNSLHVAKRIQEKLGDTELIQITSELRDGNVTIEADVLGFVFPVHAWGPPVLVKEFLKSVTIRKPGYLFAVATNGGGLKGLESTLKIFEKSLRKKGCSTNSAFVIRMPSNYITGGSVQSEEEIRKILDAADSKLPEILDTIAERKHISVPGGGFSLKSTVIYPLFAMAANKQDKKFYASEKCTGCEICEKICPVENITLSTEKKPEWRHQCQFCLACINWCPQQAIEFGNATLQKDRYHHPEIKVSELFHKKR